MTTVTLVARADRRRPNRLLMPTCPDRRPRGIPGCGDPHDAVRGFLVSPMPGPATEAHPPVGLGYGLVAHVDG